jgi:hypothetical protein
VILILLGAQILEAAGVLVIVGGAALILVRVAIRALRRGSLQGAYESYRRGLGHQTPAHHDQG